MVKRTIIDSFEMRRLNKVTVLNAIRDNKQISRIAISEKTGLNKATVSSIVDQLIQEQFVVETGLGVSKGGRKPRILTLHANAAFSIGVDIQIHSVRIVLCNLENEVLQEKVVPQKSETRMSNTDVLEMLTTEISSMMERVPDSPNGIVGIGISLPGLVDFTRGYAVYIPNMELRDFPLAEKLSNRFSIPVYVDNDANCGAWALFRKYSKARSLVYINVGIGIGVGIVIGGTLYRGKNGFAGEYGHMTIHAEGVRCRCGNYGCWEQYASEQALFRYIQDNYKPLESPYQFDQNLVQEVVKHADEGSPEAIHALQKQAYSLGIGMANIINSLDPEVVVLSGRVSLSEKYVMPEIRNVLYQRVLSGGHLFTVAMAPENTRSIGAAGIIAEEVLLRYSDAL
jgi:N-acetylglucosamine repressor